MAMACKEKDVSPICPCDNLKEDGNELEILKEDRNEPDAAFLKEENKQLEKRISNLNEEILALRKHQKKLLFCVCCTVLDFEQCNYHAVTVEINPVMGLSICD